MRTTARLTLAASVVGASALLGTPTAFAQEVCDYPFDCPSDVGGKSTSSGTGASAGGTNSVNVLPFTGGEVVLVGLTGAGALAAGTALVVAGRRRGAGA